MRKESRATYHDGDLPFLEPVPDLGHGPVDVLVVIPDDPWIAILDDPTPRPRLNEILKEIEEEIAQGKAEPLDLDRP